LFSKKVLTITGSREPHKKYLFDDLVTLRLKNQKIYLEDQKDESSVLLLEAGDGHLEFDGNKYSGTFYVYRTKKTIDIVNKLPLEDYICCVLRTEGWPGWSKEVYKVLAIACRSYLLYQLRQSKRTKRHYHICATNAHQTYSGVHSDQVIKQAVDETSGIFLAYHGQPILAMFDACCGGIIPARIKNGINFTEAPYLARSYACSYCKGFKIFNWSHDISLSKFIDLMRAHVSDLESVDDIEVVTDNAGVVQKIIITDDEQRYTINGKKAYSLLPFVKSFAYTCQKKRSRVVFKGTGYGHHVGLCQWGAKELVSQGWDYKKVLRFYYPGTNFMKLYKKASAIIPDSQTSSLVHTAGA